MPSIFKNIDIKNIKNEIDYKNIEIKNLKNELNKAKKIIEQQNITINDLQNQLNNINNNNSIELYKNIINQKDKELNKLKLELNNKNNISQNKELINIDQMMFINFISIDQNVHYSIPCLNNNTFAEVEEKLYKQFPEYRETNNQFIANGKEVLRFKTINDNKIGNGYTVTMKIPS